MSTRLQIFNRRQFLLQLLRWSGMVCGTGVFAPLAGAEPLKPSSDPCVALIIDDMGPSRRRLKEFIDLKVPLTMAVLPQLPHSVEVAAQAHESGLEVMLHQPMEPINQRLDPGPGAVYVNDPRAQIDEQLQQNIVACPYAQGVNNHMGSRFTSHSMPMRWILETLAAHDLFFVDSLTSDRSIGYGTACEIGLSAGRRNIFLDNLPQEAYITGQLKQLARIAKRHGRAIGIGHPFPATVHAIERVIPLFVENGIRLVPTTSVLQPI